MELGSFPCLAWSLSEFSPDSVLKKFLEIRPSQRWLLIGFHAAHSDRQLWTAWHCCERRFKRNNQLARSIDAEFIRYLAGTHHVSEAFQRAGVGNNDAKGWLIYLPECSEFSDGIAFPDSNYSDFFEKSASEIIQSLSLNRLELFPELNLEHAEKLGLKIDNLEIENFEDALIGFILSSEFNS